MKRFFNEEDNFFDGDDFEEVDELEGFIDYDEEAFTAFISKQDLMHAFEGGLSENELNQDLLMAAINLAKDKLFWEFRTEKMQLSAIERIYKKLLEFRNALDQKGEE